VTLFNVGVQLAAPRWVAGRALAAYQASIAGGIAIGSWIWGSTANVVGVKGALLSSSAALLVSVTLGFWMLMPRVSRAIEQALDRRCHVAVSQSVRGRLPQQLSGRCDCGPPRGQRVSAKHAVGGG
jgi:hypothetical protein